MSEKDNKESRSSEKLGGRITVTRPTVRLGSGVKKESSVPVEKKENNTVNNTAHNNEKQSAEATIKAQGNAQEGVGEQIEKEKINEEKDTSPKNSSREKDVSAPRQAYDFGAKLRDSKLSGFFKENKTVSAGKLLECGSVDIPLLMIFIMLAMYGLVMVFSASYAYAYSKEENSYVFIKNQIIYFVVGFMIVGLIVFFYDRVMNKGWIPALVTLYFIGALGMLVLIFVPGFGIMEGETKRWLDLKFISLQPSEFAKGALILFLALYFSRYEKKINKEKGFKTLLLGSFLPYGFSAVIVLLVFMENHTSGTIILGLITIMMVFFGEKKHSFTIPVLAAGLILVTVAIIYLMQFDTPEKKAAAPGIVNKIVTHYSWKRIEIWLRPEDFSIRNELWQTTQGIYAIGSGGFMGVGFGQSRQKHLFVSQPQNDFIFTIVCEEMGFVGALIVIVLFAALIWRGYKVGARIPDTFARLTVWGLTASIGMQAFLNMGVVTAILPNTGISLPFFSYGGSSIISLMIEVGIILALSRYARKDD